MTSKRVLSVFSLSMINVAAIGTLKNWPVTAEYGLSSVFFYLLAALFFFIPVSLVSAELASNWRNSGGVFLWVKEAFGERLGFLSIWFLWMENIFWYPTILSFIAAAIAYIIYPPLIYSGLYMTSSIIALFIGATFLNLKGMRLSSWISSFSVVFGSFLPGIIVIFLGLFWYFSAKPLAISFDWSHFLPDMTNLSQMVLFTGVLLSLAGMEMSAVHVKDVKNPQKDYPKAILLSGMIILISSILGSLSIAIVIPQQEINLVGGALQAFEHFMKAYHLSFFTPWMAALMAIGAIGSMSTWIVGPIKGLLAAAKAGDLPPLFRKVNTRGMPSALLWTQVIIVSILSSIFLILPTISVAFWTLTAVVAQIYLLMYLLMFMAAIRLRSKTLKSPHSGFRLSSPTFFKIICFIGMIACLFAFIICFVPPAQLPVDPILYISILILGILIACLSPSLILYFQKPHWKNPLDHEKTSSEDS
jgi:glutamate:GABA antiporter